MAKSQAGQSEIADVGRRGVAYGNEILEADDVDCGFVQIETGRRIEIERRGLLIQVPLARRVELFKDVFDKYILLVHWLIALVNLPASLSMESIVRILPGDAIVQAAPQRAL